MSWISGHPPGEVLSAAADGELLLEENVTVEAHLASCASCRAEVEAFSAVSSAVAGIAPPALAANYEDDLIKGVRAKPAPVIPIRRRFAVAASGMAAAAAAGLVLFLPSQTATTPTPAIANLVDSHQSASSGGDPTRLAPAAVPISFGGR